MTDPSSELDLARAVRRLASGALVLARTTADAQAVQWDASPVPRPRDDTSERAKGGHSDPTPLVTFDDRRLAVREAVKGAVRALDAAAQAAEEANRAVEEALESWAGLGE